MAKYKSPILEDINGQVGNLIFTHRKTKKYVMEKKKKKNNKTKPRVRTMKLQADLSEVWKYMSRADKMTWNRLLKTGYTFKNSKGKDILEGRGIFNSYNRTLQEINEAVITIAPDEPGAVQNLTDMYVDISVKGKNSSMKLYFSPKIDEETKFIIYATPKLTNDSERVNRRLYRKIAVLDTDSKSGNSIKAEYLKVFKVMPKAGDEISIKYKGVSRYCGNAKMSLSLFAIVKNQ